MHRDREEPAVVDPERRRRLGRDGELAPHLARVDREGVRQRRAARPVGDLHAVDAGRRARQAERRVEHLLAGHGDLGRVARPRTDELNLGGVGEAGPDDRDRRGAGGVGARRGDLGQSELDRAGREREASAGQADDGDVDRLAAGRRHQQARRRLAVGALLVAADVRHRAGAGEHPRAPADAEGGVDLQRVGPRRHAVVARAVGEHRGVDRRRERELLDVDGARDRSARALARRGGGVRAAAVRDDDEAVLASRRRRAADR